VHLRLLQHLLQKGSYASRRPHGHSDNRDYLLQISGINFCNGFSKADKTC